MARPSASPLACGLCKNVRVLELVQAMKLKWVGTLLNPVTFIEPVSALGEIKAVSSEHTDQKLTVTFSEDCSWAFMVDLGL